MKKSYNSIANNQNTPHLRENKIVILFSYLFSGLNFLILGWYASTPDNPAIARVCILIGVVLLWMAPLSFMDNRKEMKGNFATISAAIMHLCYCVVFSIVHSFWWIGAYVCEVVLCIAFLLTSQRKRFKK